MQKLILAVFLFAATILNAQPVKIHGQLHVDKTQLKDVHGNTVVLRGMSLSWPNLDKDFKFYNDGAVKWLCQDWYITVIRDAMNVDTKNGYLAQPEKSKAKVEEVIDAAIKEGIYVIIDWHCSHIRLNEAKGFFAEIAKKYGKYPNIIYEIFNEPEHDSWADVKAYSTEIISTIRAIDKNNIILVGSPRWDQSLNLPADDPITGYKNLMYTLHYYAGGHKQKLRDVANYALDKGLPLFISESGGMNADGKGDIDIEEWHKWIDWSEEHKISWVTWALADKNETCSVLKPQAASEGGWGMADLKESGILVREFLRKLNSAKNRSR